MNILWTPWRLKFILGSRPAECVLCRLSRDAAANDRANYVLYRGKSCYVMLNLYPYTNGHLMIAPYRHGPDMAALSSEALGEMMAMVQASVAALTRALKPHGFNIGMNLGRIAGAGIEDHLHMHVVPRWGGDANFMSVLAGTRMIPEPLEDTYDRLFPILAEEIAK
jgi:ATP adenylyltransferase